MKYHHDITLYREKSNNMPKCTNFYSTKQYIVYLLFVISKKKKKLGIAITSLFNVLDIF